MHNCSQLRKLAFVCHDQVVAPGLPRGFTVVDGKERALTSLATSYPGLLGHYIGKCAVESIADKDEHVKLCMAALEYDDGHPLWKLAPRWTMAEFPKLSLEHWFRMCTSQSSTSASWPLKLMEAVHARISHQKNTSSGLAMCRIPCSLPSTTSSATLTSGTQSTMSALPRRSRSMLTGNGSCAWSEPERSN